MINTERTWHENKSQRLSVRAMYIDVFSNKHLAVLLAWRSITVKTKQAFLGHLWPILQPLVSSLVFLMVFNKIAGIDTTPVPYLLFVYTGTMVWGYVNSSTSAGTASIIANAGIVTKTYFPRIVLPISSCLAPFYNLLISGIVLVLLFVIYGVELSMAMLTLPFWVFMLFMLVVGYTLVFAPLNVIYRDVGQLGNYLAQLWMYASPVAYPSSLIADAYKPLYYINPLAGLLDGFRWALLGTDLTPLVIISFVSLLLLLCTGLYVFAKFERTLADHL